MSVYGATPPGASLTPPPADPYWYSIDAAGARLGEGVTAERLSPTSVRLTRDGQPPMYLSGSDSPGSMDGLFYLRANPGWRSLFDLLPWLSENGGRVDVADMDAAAPVIGVAE